MTDGPASSPRTSPAAQAGEAVTGRPVTPAGATQLQASVTAPEQAGSGGLPQFRTEYWGAQIIWLLIMFGLLYALMVRVFVPRLRAVRDLRDTTIETALAEGHRARREADAQAEAVKAEMAEARARAQKTAADAKARSQADAYARQGALEAELAAKLATAEDAIRVAREGAMGQVRGVAAQTAALIAERLTGRAPAAGEVDAALDALPARA